MRCIIKYFNDRVKTFTIIDIKLLQIAAMFVALILVKVFPQILKIGAGWLIVLALLFALRPIYVMFIKPGGNLS